MTPVESDRLTNLVAVGSNTPQQPFKTVPGKGSRLQDLESGLVAYTFHLIMANLRKITEFHRTIQRRE